MCGIWDWQSTIVKDLNDSQDLKHTLFCCEIVFVAIYALFSDNKCPLYICITVREYIPVIFSKLVCSARTRAREIYLSIMFHEYICTSCLTQGEYICKLSFTQGGYICAPCLIERRIYLWCTCFKERRIHLWCTCFIERR